MTIISVLIIYVEIHKETLWQIEPHTAAKHEILRKYLDAWFPILGTYNKRIVYLDGFSGPGRYIGNEPGSPIVALKSALTHRAKLDVELVFLFIEERKDRAEYLDGEIAKLQCPDHFKISVERGSFADKTGALLDELDGTKSRLAPTFALIDPFGFSGIPYVLMQRLLGNPKCEVLITFMVDSINRWLTHPDEGIRAHIVETFGTDEALQVASETGDRVTALKNLYFRQLKKAAGFVRYFELRDWDSRVVYYLFFASNNPTGHLKMKEAMWKVDPLGSFSFSDSTDPNQQILFANPSTAPLVPNLVSKFHGAGQIPVGEVEAHVQNNTGYLRKHMGEALGQLESSGQLEVSEIKTDGKKRRAHSYPNEALVTFR
jgi:three-Cys-motif partner protein